MAASVAFCIASRCWPSIRVSPLRDDLSLQRSFLQTVVFARKAKVEGRPKRETSPSKRTRTATTTEEFKNVEVSSCEDSHGLIYDNTPDFEFEHGYSVARVCDRLIEVFLLEKTTEEDWRKLLVLSAEWSKIKHYFFKRLEYRIKLEQNVSRMESFRGLSEKLKVVDDDMERHNQLLCYVKEHWPELDVVVAGRRKEFNDSFFHYIELLCDSLCHRADKRDDLVRVAAKCLAAVEAHDRAVEDKVLVTIAQKKFDDVLNSDSLDEACEKIDLLAKKKQLDSTLMLLFAKGWAAAQESATMTEEVKELMHHLYLVARGHLQRLIPKEIRMLQHILSIEDPTQRFSALSEAFAPAEESVDKDREDLHTKPEKLHKWMKLVLDGYYFNKQNTVIESARQLMNPTIITRLLQLKEVVEDQFM